MPSDVQYRGRGLRGSLVEFLLLHHARAAAFQSQIMAGILCVYDTWAASKTCANILEFARSESSRVYPP